MSVVGVDPQPHTLCALSPNSSSGGALSGFVMTVADGSTGLNGRIRDGGSRVALLLAVAILVVVVMRTPSASSVAPEVTPVGAATVADSTVVTLRPQLGVGPTLTNSDTVHGAATPADAEVAAADSTSPPATVEAPKASEVLGQQGSQQPLDDAEQLQPVVASAAPAAVPANGSSSALSLFGAKRPLTDFDYHTDAFDSVVVPRAERVAAPIPEHVADLVKPGAAPVDAVVLFPFAAAIWEAEYLPRDLLPRSTNGGRLAVLPISVDKWDGGNPNPPLSSLTRRALFNDTTSANADEVPPIIWAAHLSDSYNANHNCPKRVTAKLMYYRPTVVLVLSDEHGRTFCLHSMIANIGMRARRGAPADEKPPLKLVLRQYSKKTSGNILGGNIKTMPLGYMAGTMALPPSLERDVLRKASTRRLAWSFVGSSKGSRAAMIETMSRMVQPFVASAKGGFPPLAMHRVYGDSKFVLSPKGFARLDCFRLYEASRVGAIPVVVGHVAEMRNAFNSYVGERKGAMPPWVFAHSWPEAAGKMQSLMRDRTGALDKRQRAVLRWWDRVNFNMRLAIFDALVAATAPATPPTPLPAED
jgi:hypothetical protein